VRVRGVDRLICGVFMASDFGRIYVGRYAYVMAVMDARRRINMSRDNTFGT